MVHRQPSFDAADTVKAAVAGEERQCDVVAEVQPPPHGVERDACRPRIDDARDPHRVPGGRGGALHEVDKVSRANVGAAVRLARHDDAVGAEETARPSPGGLSRARQTVHVRRIRRRRRGAVGVHQHDGRQCENDRRRVARRRLRHQECLFSRVQHGDRVAAKQDVGGGQDRQVAHARRRIDGEVGDHIEAAGGALAEELEEDERRRAGDRYATARARTEGRSGRRIATAASGHGDELAHLIHASQSR